MRLLRQLFDFYLDASIHVALAVLSLIYVTVNLFQISLDIHLALFIFFTTIASYNFIKYGVEAEKYILVSNAYHRYIQFFSFVAAGVAAYHVQYLNYRVWAVLGVLAILVGLYALPVLPHARNLRNLGILKILMVGFVWGGATVILPYLAVADHLPWDVHVEALQRFLLVLVLMLPFEIRDMAIDNPRLKTIPQRLGVNATRILGGVAGLFFFLLTYLKDTFTIPEVLGKALLFIILIIVMWRTRQEQTRYFASFWVEMVPILWLFILLTVDAVYS
jgi:hypothetical protein